ncbi:unnamed protein product [Parascedosporium putredinis]|uniref:Uncharacterized protein n=1 Tax=Parascedosporium putredinis TaxID=1442378 RepID=A0A9P1H2B9_9PEZI|nr:unnamed protein product [Parascedosporium putredinis]CAI7994804.1 unnamed protein product [Parascedosporium putredinis]
MSTIASPRDPSTPSAALHPASTPQPQSPQPGTAPSTKRNRTALREYYNLRRSAGTPSSSAPVINEDSRTSEVAPSEIDAEGSTRRCVTTWTPNTHGLGTRPQDRSDLQTSIPDPRYSSEIRPQAPEGAKIDEESIRRQQKTRRIAAEVVSMPPKLRALVAEGKLDEARQAWELPRQLLELWRDKNLGGPDVLEVLKEGDAIVEWEEDESSSGTSADGS